MFTKKIQLCYDPAKLDAIRFAQHALAIMHVFHTACACSQNARIPDRGFLQMTLLISSVVRVKSRFCSVVGGVWN